MKQDFIREPNLRKFYPGGTSVGIATHQGTQAKRPTFTMESCYIRHREWIQDFWPSAQPGNVILGTSPPPFPSFP